MGVEVCLGHKIPFVTPSPVVYFLTCIRLFSWHGHEGKESSVHSKKQTKNISNKTKVFVLGSFPLPAGGNLTNQVWLIIKTRKHLLYLWRIRVPLTPEILKSSRSWTTISRLGSFVSEFLTYRQKKKKKKREGKKYIFSCGIHTHHLHVKLCEHACWKTCKPSTWIMCKSCSVSNALLSLHHVAAHSDASPDIPTTN